MLNAILAFVLCIPLVFNAAEPAKACGHIAWMPPEWGRVQMWAAPFIPFEEGGKSGFFVLDLAGDQSTFAQQGDDFCIEGLYPGEYVLIGGPNEFGLGALRNKWGLPAVWRVAEGETLDLGNVTLR